MKYIVIRLICAQSSCAWWPKKARSRPRIFFISNPPTVQRLISDWHRQDASLVAFLVLPIVLRHLRVTIDWPFVLTKTLTVVRVKDEHVATCPLQQAAMSCPKERRRFQHPMNVLGSVRKLEPLHVHHSTALSSESAIKWCEWSPSTNMPAETCWFS